MQKATIYDTETTNFPNWKVPSGDKSQPHLVSLAALQCNAETGNIIQSIDLIIKPEGWESSEGAFNVHGITKEYSMDVGISEQLAIEMLIDLCSNSIRVAHNKKFDQRIIRIGLKRYLSEQIQEKWAEKESHKCTMQMAKPIMKLPMVGRGGLKNPNLAEAYKYFTGKELKNAHSAMVDTKACKEIYFAMMELEKNNIEDPCKICEFKTGDMYPPECIKCEHDIPF